MNISSLMDTWLLVRYLESNGERNRGLYILKSRGMNHSNQVREFCLTDHGFELLDVYLGEEGIMVGSARVTHEAQALIEAENHAMELTRKKHEIELKQQEITNQISLLQASINSLQDELNRIDRVEELRKSMEKHTQVRIALSRRAEDSGDEKSTGPEG